MSSLPDSSPVVAILLEVVHLVALHQELLSPEASLLVDQEATGADNPNLGTVYVVRKSPGWISLLKLVNTDHCWTYFSSFSFVKCSSFVSIFVGGGARNL